METISKQKIVIVGGTGFIGQGLVKNLPPDLFEIHSLSRHSFMPSKNDSTIYHAVDLEKPEQWQGIIADADWVIDAVGILFPNPLKHQTYHKNSVKPAKQLIAILKQETQPKFLFISANTGPFFMKPYLKAKLTVETLAKTQLGSRAFIVYPGIVFDKDRRSSYLLGILIKKCRHLSYFDHLRSISRLEFATEIEQILLGFPSHLLKRTVTIK